MPPTAQEAKLLSDSKPDPKADLPREYLVKWKDRGFRHATWVPHNWLKVTAMMKLRNFLEKGPQLALITDETLAARGDDMAHPTIANIHEAETSKAGCNREEAKTGGPPPDVNAEASIPEEWRVSSRSYRGSQALRANERRLTGCWTCAWSRRRRTRPGRARTDI